MATRPWRRFWGRIKARGGRYLSGPITRLSVLSAMFVAGLVLVVGVAPVMREQGRSWGTRQDWIHALKLTGPALLAGLLLKVHERLKWLRGRGRQERRFWRRRKLSTARALMELQQNLSTGKRSPADMRHVREVVLQAIAGSAANILQLDDPGSIVATLLDFSSGSLSKMRVVARSSSERPIQIEYDSESLVAWQALKTRRIAFEDDVHGSPVERRYGKRAYGSVLALPVVREEKAVAALSLDAKESYAFVGRAVDIEISLQPYVAVLALTYEHDALHLECPYDAAHVG